MYKMRCVHIAQSLIITMISLFFGSFLFVGLLEEYKNDLSFKKTIMDDIYRPMVDMHVQFNQRHNLLFLEYAKFAGTNQMMLNEIEHIVKTHERDLGGDYAIWAMSVQEANQKVAKETERLKAEVNEYRSKLYRKYEEVALMTGTYKKYRELITKATNNINSIYKERSERSKEFTKDINLNDIMPTMRKMLLGKSNVQSIKEIKKLAKITVNLYLMLSENEQKIFNEENKLFEELHHLFAEEISYRFKRGFIRSLFWQ